VDLVVDANILFAALIKNGITAKLLFLEDLHLYAPEFLLDEFNKHRKYLLDKTHRTKEDFNEILEILACRIIFIPLEDIELYLEKADKISPDPDDSIYFAIALKIGASIWTNEKRLQKQNIVNIYTTSDLLDLFESNIN
jgi:predicted nucleic acid-binding protein